MANVTEAPLDPGALSDLFGWPEYLVFAGMLGISAGIGLFFGCTGNKQKTTSEFLMGNRSLGVFPIASSLIASFISAITLLGTPAEVYSKGTLYWMIGISYIFVTAAAAFIYLPVFFDLQLTSAYETIYMAIVVYAPSLALSQVTGLNVYGCVVAIFVICTFYTTVGGMKAVVWTDTIQVIIMFAAMLIVIFKGAFDVGGHAAVWNIAKEGGRIEFFNFDFDPRTRHTVWGLLFGGYFTWVTVYGCNQAQVQRYLSVPTKRKAQWALLVNMFGLIGILSLCCYAGLVIYARYATCDPIISKRVNTPDQLFPLFVMDTLGTFRGSSCTVSSGLNSLAAITLEDFVRGVFYPNISDERATTVSKLLAVAFGLISFGLVFVAEQLGGVLQAALSIFGIIGGPLLGVFSLGMFFPWANWKGAFGGTISALLFTLWIGIGANVAITSKQIIVPKLNVSVDGCGWGNFTVPPLPVEPEHDSGLIEMYRISYIWYSAIGCCVTVFIGLILSFLTGPQDPRKLDPKLISPAVDTFVRWLFSDDILYKIGWELGKPVSNGHYSNGKSDPYHSNGTFVVDAKTGIRNPAFRDDDNPLPTSNGKVLQNGDRDRRDTRL
ncbi:Sodium-coupled monocarboxylate transporter 2 [Orchesella cincta]|uniref:Sodium-coupled monocarboxylate transporter 2 n=1 Tax=Orchesella cincta TaxID=48709 RepID=A0A1D2NDQ5_ORCCI|nr:Sodium-coupled monocarboxylate transporter 2 [Orchesella cincta]